MTRIYLKPLDKTVELDGEVERIAGPKSKRFKSIRLTGPKAQRLSELAAHKDDLLIAKASLEGVPALRIEGKVDATTETWAKTLEQSLWRSAIMHYWKCFSPARDRDPRSPLEGDEVFKGYPEILKTHKIFGTLRNKHVGHDVSPLCQYIPIAFLNRSNSQRKIEWVSCAIWKSETLNQGNFNNLYHLTMETLSYVDACIKSLRWELTAELEARPYQELEAMEEVVYDPPKPDAVGGPRARHC